MDWNDLLGEFQGRSSSPQKNNNMSWLGSLFTGASGVLGNIIQGVYNTRQVETTNKANRELVQMQNAAAKEEAELAYQRSRPENQVANMMNAGMSRAGAINALNGGGSYQPAPVNTPQDQAPQIDTTSAINAIQSAAQLQEQKRQFNMQHAEQKRQFNLNHAETKRMNDDALLTSGKQRELLGVEIDGKSIANDLLKIEREVANANKDGRIETEKLENVARQAQAVLDKFKSDKVYNVMQGMSDEDLEGVFKMQAWLNMLETGIQSKVPKMVTYGVEKLGAYLAKIGLKK